MLGDLVFPSPNIYVSGLQEKQRRVRNINLNKLTIKSFWWLYELINSIEYEFDKIRMTYWLLLVELIKYCSINSFKFSNVFR